MKSKLSLVILPILVAMVSIPLCAQQRAKQSWDNLNRLQAGQKVQVVQMDMKSLKGRFLGFTEETISVRVKKDEVAVARADVLRISLRGKPRRTRNTLIGLGTGAGIGLAVGAGVDAASKEPNCTFLCLPNIGKQVFTPLGFLIGGVVGVLIPIPGYRTIYRAKVRQRSTAP